MNRKQKKPQKMRKNHQEQALAFFPPSIGFDLDLPEWLIGG